MPIKEKAKVARDELDEARLLLAIVLMCLCLFIIQAMTHADMGTVRMFLNKPDASAIVVCA